MFSYKNKNILIVDDQKAFHVMLRMMLTNQGAKNICFADNVESAVKLAQQKKFDIYLIDYNLGAGKNGSQLIDYLRKNKLISKNALCFIITGDNSKGMVLTAIEKSPDDYLMKPFSQTQLFNRLSKAAQKKLMLADIFDALENKKYPEAIALCKEKLAEKPKFKGLLNNLLADIYIENKEFTAAEQILKALIENRFLIRASINLGKTYYLQKKYSHAIELLKKVSRHAPLQMDTYQWLARSYQKNGELNKALNILTHAAHMTHHSIDRHQEVALLANEMHEHNIMLSSYAAILQLSRNSFYPDPCHLANYIRSIIDYAKDENDLDKRKVILKKVTAVLYQARFEEGRDKKFDFNLFDEICQAKVRFALNKPLQAKRQMLSAMYHNETHISQFDSTLLCENLFSLLDIGEFDHATPYLNELKQRNIIDPTMQAAVNKQTGKQLESRIHSFKIHNKLGIRAFMDKAYERALEHFNEALELAPINSGALLNRIQVYIELLKSPKNSTQVTLLKHCQNSFDLLHNVHLPDEHDKRYRKLKGQFIQLKQSFPPQLAL